MQFPSIAELARKVAAQTGQSLADAQAAVFAAAQRAGQAARASSSHHTPQSVSPNRTPVEGSSAHIQRLAAEYRSREIQQIRQRALGQPTPTTTTPVAPVHIDVGEIARAYAQQHGCDLATAQRIVYAARQRLAQ